MLDGNAPGMRGLPTISNLHLLMAVWILLIRQSMANPNAKRLYDDILMQKGYNKLVRPPPSNMTETLVVRLGLKLAQLIDVECWCGRSLVIFPHQHRSQDERNQILTTNVWIKQQWEDSSLRWDPMQYGGVDHMYVPADKIWLPDIVLFNNADGTYEASRSTKATVNSTGTVKWNPPAVFKSSCDINIEFFPFDEQECSMIFGSWTYDGREIELKHMWDHTTGNDHQIVGIGMALNGLYPNAEWDLMAVPAERQKNNHGDSYITFRIKLRRRSLFYVINLMVPCISLCFVTCLVFYLPADSRQKMTFCINILLSLTVFFLLLAEIIPPTSLVVPLIGKYLLFTMYLVAASVIVTVVVLNVHYRTRATHELPWWVRKVFLEFLPKVLIMRRPKLLEFVQRSQKIKSMRKKAPSNKWNGIINVGLAEERFPARSVSRFPYDTPPLSRQPHGQYGNVIENGMNPQMNNRRHFPRPKPSNKLSMVRGHTDCEGCRRGMCFGIENNHIWYSTEAERTMAAVQYIATHLMDEDEDRKVREEWKYIALVIDRLFLWIFGGMSVIGTFAVCLRAPSLFDKTPPLHIGQDLATAPTNS